VSCKRRSDRPRRIGDGAACEEDPDKEEEERRKPRMEEDDVLKGVEEDQA
jgi:hypothetical protein